MNKIIFSILVLIMVAGKTVGQYNNASGVSEKIARKMKDTLDLTQMQFNSIYSINIELYNQKMAVRKVYTDMDSLRFYIQKVESYRDSLYRNVLDTNQMLLYRQKKRYLVSAN